MPFGRSMTSAEEYVADLDSKTGASLKLSILNPKVGLLATRLIVGEEATSPMYQPRLSALHCYNGYPSKRLTCAMRALRRLVHAWPAELNGLRLVLSAWEKL